MMGSVSRPEDGGPSRAGTADILSAPGIADILSALTGYRGGPEYRVANPTGHQSGL